MPADQAQVVPTRPAVIVIVQVIDAMKSKAGWAIEPYRLGRQIPVKLGDATQLPCNGCEFGKGCRIARAPLYIVPRDLGRSHRSGVAGHSYGVRPHHEEHVLYGQRRKSYLRQEG